TAGLVVGLLAWVGDRATSSPLAHAAAARSGEPPAQAKGSTAPAARPGGTAPGGKEPSPAPPSPQAPPPNPDKGPPAPPGPEAKPPAAPEAPAPGAGPVTGPLGEVLQLKGPGSAITALAVSADGKRLLTGDADGSVRLWDVDEAREVRVLKDARGEKI